MIFANDFKGKNDSEIINNAIRHRTGDGIVVIGERLSDIEPERTFWLLDEAILMPENTTVILRNCKLKLSDRCRDNFFRSANCGIGINIPERIKNIHINNFDIFFFFFITSLLSLYRIIFLLYRNNHSDNSMLNHLKT